MSTSVVPPAPRPSAPSAALAARPRARASDLRGFGAAMVGAAFIVPHAPSVGPLCPLRRLTGIPCPLCGMTTGVVATVHGRLWDALGANPAAPLLVVVVILAWVGWAITRLGVAPALVRWSPPRWVRPAAELARYPLLGLLWLFELHRFGYV